MTAIWQGKSPRLRTLDAMAYSVIIGIVNDHHHWMLTVMYPHDKRCLFIDPLGESQSNIKRCQESTRAFMRKKGCNVSRWACSTLPHARQQDGTSCGVLALKFAEKILTNQQTVNMKTTITAVNRMRQDIATRLLRESDLL
ncbi:uncharacterized protein LOC144031777 [Festucalex cinctus]